MWAWPELQLTKYERKFVSYYKHFDPKSKTMIPGVLKRVYKVVLNDTAVATSSDFSQIHTIGSVQIARRSRVFGLRFMGDVDSYFVNIRTATGEGYTNGPCLVSALCPGTQYNNNGARIGAPPVAVVASPIQHFGMAALNIDPNWELQPNQTLVFEGTLPTGVTAKFLKIGIHVWEFPGMEMASGGA